MSLATAARVDCSDSSQVAPDRLTRVQAVAGKQVDCCPGSAPAHNQEVEKARPTGNSPREKITDDFGATVTHLVRNRESPVGRGRSESVNNREGSSRASVTSLMA